jgi:hypothetical protein
LAEGGIRLLILVWNRKLISSGIIAALGYFADAALTYAGLATYWSAIKLDDINLSPVLLNKQT